MNISDMNDRGYGIALGILNSSKITELKSEVLSSLDENKPAGIRGLASKIQMVRNLAQSQEICSILEPILGGKARLVSSILFNKGKETNWHVAWHQDLSIAVRERVKIEGYTNWTEKDGILHVQPPATVLENMLTIRIHLDPADKSNGALCVSPGTHRLGRISAKDATATAQKYGEFLCEVHAGDAVVMRPLILHSSHKATTNRPRRVIHLEYTACDLPEPLEWYEGR